MKYIIMFSLFLMCVLVCLPPAGMAQDSTSQTTLPAAEPYPKIGLVLSGGGARGFAHVGAIKVLEEIGMPVDYVVGTSMGSIIGGLYAIGYSADELVDVIGGVDWESLFSDTPPRNLWSYQKKRESAKYILGVEFNRKGFVVPMGLTAGQKISNLMTFLTLRASDVQHFDHFDIPYRAVAADIVTGEEVVLERGVLAEAMRASMAVPGVFTPVKIDDHLLVDGGVVKNLPVDVAQRMGADIIIAIDISSPLKSEEELTNPLAILNQMIGLQILNSTERQRKLADLTIVADLKEYSSTSFGSAPEIIALGEESTRAQLDELRKLLELIRATRPASRSLAERKRREAQEIFIEDITVEGPITSYDQQRILTQLKEQKGRILDPELVEQKITEIFSSGKYETVKFTLSPGEGEGKVLNFRLEERQRSGNLLRFGGYYESRFDDADEDKMVFLLNTTFNGLSGPGSSWSTGLQFVNVTKIESEYSQPLGKGFFVTPYIYDFDDYQLLYEDKESVARYNKRERAAGLRFGTFIRRIGEVSLGFKLEDIDVSPSTAVTQELFPSFNEAVTSLTFHSHIDNLDTFPFPHSGTMLEIDYQFASETFGGEVDFHRLLLEYWRYFSFKKRNILGLRIQAGTDFKSDLRLYKQFLLGGRDSFVGYKVEERRGVHLGTMTLEYLRKIYELPSAVGGEIFAVATGNVGNLWESFDEMKDDFSVRYGGSLGIGANTIIGPVRLDFSIGDGGRQNLYLNVGYKF